MTTSVLGVPAVGRYSRNVGGSTGRTRAIVRRASPISYVGVTSPPTFLLHGTQDCLVPARQSARLYRTLVAFGVPAHYVTLEAPHGGPLFHTTPRITGQVIAFLDEALHVERPEDAKEGRAALSGP